MRELPRPNNPAAERRVLLAASVRLGARTVSLVTAHTAPGGPDLAAQLAALRRFVTPIASGGPAVVGGDLNALPDNPGLTGFYGPRYGGTGVFREANDTRINPAPTFSTVPRKIDYLFGSFLTPRGSGTVTTPFSDHRMYLGTFG